MVLSIHVLEYIVRCIVRQFYFVALAPSVPKRLKINDLITRDSREFPAPDPLVIPGYKPDSRRFETGSIPVKSRTARKLKSPTPQKDPDYTRCWAHTPQYLEISHRFNALDACPDRNNPSCTNSSRSVAGSLNRIAYMPILLAASTLCCRSST